MFGAEIEVTETCFLCVFFCLFEHKSAIGVAPVFFGDVYSAYPGIQIHPAYKIIGDQPGATDDFSFFFQQIPLRQSLSGPNAVTYAVFVKYGGYFRYRSLLHPIPDPDG